MSKGLIAYSLIPFIIFGLIFIGLKTDETVELDGFSVECLELDFNLSDELAYADTQTTSTTSGQRIATPKLGKSFIGFKEAIAFKESRGDYFTVNTLGYLGKYQFGSETLKLIGIYDTQDFLNNPELQEKAFIANTMRNKWILRRDINRFVGKHIDGVLITESGILAAAHLAGPGSVKKYLRSYGALGFTDAYGTTVRNYMKRFAGYDTSFIIPDKNAKASIL